MREVTINGKPFHLGSDEESLYRNGEKVGRISESGCVWVDGNPVATKDDVVYGDHARFGDEITEEEFVAAIEGLNK